MNPSPLPRPALLALAVAGSLLAGDPEPRIGLQATLAMPQGDLKAWTGGNPGFGVGIHSMEDMGKGEAFRPRLDVQVFRGRPNLIVPVPPMAPAADGSFPPVLESHSFDNSFLVWTLSLDSLYFFSGESDIGFYLLGGFGLSISKLNSTVAGTQPVGGNRWPGAGTRFADSSKKFAGSAGFGYQLNRSFGIETRVTWSRGQFRPVNLKLPSVALGVTYQFP